MFQDIFDEIVKQCIVEGLLTGKHLTVDTNASLNSLEEVVVQISSREFIESKPQVR